ncbi:MAG: DUF2505 domain-containing protein [Cellvibrionales bacterium]|nr:DUF2505 domain-containing protein [Cellvibrionales bacterium]
MGLKFTFNHSADNVFDAFTDPDFLVDRALALGELSAEVEIEETDTTSTIKMRREVIRDLPKFLAKLFDPKQVLNVEERWTKSGNDYKGQSEFTVEGQPVLVKTKTTLTSTPDGCEFSIDYDAKAKIPLVGGKVEKFIISNCLEGTQKELEYTNEKLNESIAV